MSYITVEVEIDHGQIVAREPAKLPEKGKGLLTVLESGESSREAGNTSRIEAFHALQKSLDLDDAKASAWMDVIRDGRR